MSFKNFASGGAGCPSRRKGRRGPLPIRNWRPPPPPSAIFLNPNVSVVMSGRNPNQTPNVPPTVGMDRDGCMRIAAGERWLSLDDGLDPTAVRAVLDECYRILRAEAERA